MDVTLHTITATETHAFGDEERPFVRLSLADREPGPQIGGFPLVFLIHEVEAFDRLISAAQDARSQLAGLLGWKTCARCGRDIERDDLDGWVDADGRCDPNGSFGQSLVYCHDQDETQDRIRHTPAAALVGDDHTGRVRPWTTSDADA